MSEATGYGLSLIGRTVSRAAMSEPTGYGLFAHRKARVEAWMD
jgi:hypothetical protein